jgi:hypothetical protein
MAATHKTQLFIWIISLAVILACVPSLAVPSASTPNPGAVNTFIAQTANAAATQTAKAMPTLTPTPTITPTQNTETPTFTATSTVIFILSSPTSPVIPTFTRISTGGGGGSGGGSSSDNFACQVISVSPANGTSFNARADFDAVWHVKNIGQKNWDRNSVDYIYLSGSKIHKVSGYDLSTTVVVGSTTDITVDMQAPKNAGTYSTTWTLRVGNKNFCSMSLTIVVK